MHGSILHDVSYYSLIELRGPERVLKTLLELCCDPQGHGPGAKRYATFSVSYSRNSKQSGATLPLCLTLGWTFVYRYLTGCRTLDTHLYKPGSFPFHLIAPITILWRAVCSALSRKENASKDSGGADPNGEANRKEGERGRGQPQEQNQGEETSAGLDISRIVWIRSHPAVFEDVFSALQTSASLTLDGIRRASNENDKPLEVELADLRGQVNVFEIVGPRSSQVIKGALTPVAEDKREVFQKVGRWLWTRFTYSNCPFNCTC